MMPTTNPNLPTVRTDWTMPPPPQSDSLPCAHNVGPNDGWDLYWATAQQAEDGTFTPDEHGHGIHIDWPFGPDDWAGATDLKAIGFHIVD